MNGFDNGANKVKNGMDGFGAGGVSLLTLLKKENVIATVFRFQ